MNSHGMLGTASLGSGQHQARLPHHHSPHRKVLRLHRRAAVRRRVHRRLLPKATPHPAAIIPAVHHRVPRLEKSLINTTPAPAAPAKPIQPGASTTTTTNNGAPSKNASVAA